MHRSIVLLLATLVFVLPLATRSGMSAAAQDTSFITVAQDPANGAILTDSEGMTLYLFTRDTNPGESTCEGDCLVNWPPLQPADDMALPAGVPGELGTADLADGTQIVTYNDIPLYYFAADEAPGDINGQGRGGVWFVVHPGATHGPYAPAPGEGTPVPASTIEVGFTEELGPFLTDAEGMTLYLFTNDTNPGESTCEGDCLVNWPPVPAADMLVLPPGIQGTLGATEALDGTQMLTYNDIPLYYFAADQAPGDVNGQGRGDVWYVVAPGMMHGEAPMGGAAATPTA